MDVKMVTDGNMTRPEPPLDEGWSDRVKLEWKAALVSLESGLAIDIHPADYRVKKFGVWVKAKPDHYNIMVVGDYGSSTSGPFLFNEAWTYLNGVETGARSAAWT